MTSWARVEHDCTAGSTGAVWATALLGVWCTMEQEAGSAIAWEQSHCCCCCCCCCCIAHKPCEGLGTLSLSQVQAEVESARWLVPEKRGELGGAGATRCDRISLHDKQTAQVLYPVSLTLRFASSSRHTPPTHRQGSKITTHTSTATKTPPYVSLPLLPASHRCHVHAPHATHVLRCTSMKHAWPTLCPRTPYTCMPTCTSATPKVRAHPSLCCPRKLGACSCAPAPGCPHGSS